MRSHQIMSKILTYKDQHYYYSKVKKIYCTVLVQITVTGSKLKQLIICKFYYNKL
jgi:hypothetical protein